tara:strand:- start:225 stop:770 length:546 start_codon:yes stop_codon:yes gene_type:complete
MNEPINLLKKIYHNNKHYYEEQKNNYNYIKMLQNRSTQIKTLIYYINNDFDVDLYNNPLLISLNNSQKTLTSHDSFYETIKLLDKYKNRNKQIQIIKKTHKSFCKLLLTNFHKILPLDIVYHISTKMPFVHKKKKQPTNWQNFIRHRKLLQIQDNKTNSQVWTQLSQQTKNKYKNKFFNHY